MIPKPDSSEYQEFYAGYIRKVADESDLRSLMLAQIVDVERLQMTPGEERSKFRYAEGKWSVREVIGHITDAERIFGYRVLRIGRGDETPLPGFEENAYVSAGEFDQRTLASLVSEWRQVREATIRLIEGLPSTAWERRGTASGWPVSARAVAWITAGHTAHHLAVLRERYLTE